MGQEWALFKRNENLGSSQELYQQPQTETTEMFFNRQMIKRTTVHPHHRTLLSNKKEHTTDTRNNLGEAPENYAE